MVDKLFTHKKAKVFSKRLALILCVIVTWASLICNNGAHAYMYVYKRNQNNGMDWQVADERLAQAMPEGHDQSFFGSSRPDISNWVIVSLKGGLSKQEVSNHVNWLLDSINKSNAKINSTQKSQAAQTSQAPQTSQLHCLYLTGYAGQFSEDIIKKLEKRKDILFVRRDGYLNLMSNEKNGKDKRNDIFEIEEEAPINGALKARKSVVRDNNNDDKNKTNDGSTVPQSISEQGLSFPNGPSWGLDRINQHMLPLDGLFSTPTPRGAGVDVYVLDAGVRLDHIEFEGRARYGPTFVTKTSEDKFGHGTHVSGIIAGKTVGVASQANIISVKVMYDDGVGSVSSIVMGLDWAVRNSKITRRPSIINMSIGTGKRDDTLDHAVISAVQQGLLVVASGGNNNRDSCNYSPSNLMTSLTVGATDPFDRKAPYSNYGNCIKIYAPGSHIRSASYLANNTYRLLNGTSMAAPYVTGAAAVYLSKFPNSPPMETMMAILRNATQRTVKDPVRNGGYAPFLYLSDGSSSYRIRPLPSEYIGASQTESMSDGKEVGGEEIDDNQAIEKDLNYITSRPRKLASMASPTNSFPAFSSTLLISAGVALIAVTVNA